MQTAFREGAVDGQENPIWLILPYRLWAVHKYVTLWRYAIDPVILAVSAKAWGGLSAADRNVVRAVGEEVMAQEKREVREGLDETMTVIHTLQKVYGMEAVNLTPAEVQAFRDKTRRVYTKWADEIGSDLVRSAERAVESSR